MSVVICRTRLSHDCDHGKPERAVYGTESQASDGTWDGRSVICTPCYMRLMPFTPSGTAELHELAGAIHRYREAQRPMVERVEGFVMVNEAEGFTTTREDMEGGAVKIMLWPRAAEGTTVEPAASAVIRPGRPIVWV